MEFLSSDRYQDLVTEGIDVASVSARCRIQSAIAAGSWTPRASLWRAALPAGTRVPASRPNSPATRSSSGRARVDDLRVHRCGKVTSVRANSRLSPSTSTKGRSQALWRGSGSLVKPGQRERRARGPGSLTRVLADWDLGSMEIKRGFRWWQDDQAGRPGRLRNSCVANCGRRC